MYALIGEFDISTFGNFGIAGALLVFAWGVHAYLTKRDDRDAIERQKMSDSYHRVIDNLALKIESMGETQLNAFAVQMAAERVEHRKDLHDIGAIIHDVRALASTAVTAKEYAARLEEKLEERRKREEGQ